MTDDTLFPIKISAEQRTAIEAAWQRRIAALQGYRSQLFSEEANLGLTIAQGLDRKRAAERYARETVRIQRTMEELDAEFLNSIDPDELPIAVETKPRVVYFRHVPIGLIIAGLTLIDFDMLEEMGIKPSVAAMAEHKEGEDAHDFNW